MDAKDVFSSLLHWRQRQPPLPLIDYWAWRKHLHVPLLQHWKTKPKPVHSLEIVFFKVYALLNNKHRHPQNHQSSNILLPIFAQISMSAEVPNYFPGSGCSSLKTPAWAGAACLISRQRVVLVYSSPCAKGLQLKNPDICRERVYLLPGDVPSIPKCSSASSKDRAMLALTST